MLVWTCAYTRFAGRVIPQMGKASHPRCRNAKGIRTPGSLSWERLSLADVADKEQQVGLLKKKIFYNDLPAPFVKELWQRFIEALALQKNAGKLTAVHFQCALGIAQQGRGLIAPDLAISLGSRPCRVGGFRVMSSAIGQRPRRRIWEPQSRATQWVSR
jgi:hypothetical protein